jgi:hypothetical protein
VSTRLNGGMAAAHPGMTALHRIGPQGKAGDRYHLSRREAFQSRRECRRVGSYAQSQSEAKPVPRPAASPILPWSHTCGA